MEGDDARQEDDVAIDVSEDATPEFDRFVGVLTDGVVGGLGGLAGTVTMTVVLLAGSSVGAVNVEQFSLLASLLGFDVLLPVTDVAAGYLVFLAIGMFVWPLLLASIGRYLPGDRFAVKGIPFGVALWTGFSIQFYSGESGSLLLAYLAITLVAHVAYGFSVGTVFDYFSTRPETLV
jgi:hypothetical protein